MRGSSTLEAEDRASARGILSSPWLIAPSSNLVIGLLGLVASALVARAIGPAERGILTGATLWGTLLLAGLGLPALQAVVFHWRDRRDHGPVLGAGLTLAALSALVVIPAAAALSVSAVQRLGASGAVTAVIGFVVCLPAQLLGSTFLGAFLADHRHRRFWSVRIFQAAAYLAVAATGAIAGWTSATAYVWGMALASVAATLLAAVLFVSAYGPLRPRLEGGLVPAMGRFSLKSNASGLPYQLNLRVDQAMMVFLTGAATNGYYAIAFTWSSILMLVGGGFSSVVLSRARGRTASELGPVFAQIRAVVAVLIVVALGAAAVAPFAIPRLFGASFAPAIAPAVILCLGSLILNVTLMLHEVAKGIGAPELGIPAEGAALAATMVLVWLLVPRYGGLGAAVASLLSYATGFAVLSSALRRRIGGGPTLRLAPTVRDLRLVAQWLTRR